MQKYIIFRLGDKEFGIEINKIVEVLKSRAAMKLPETEDFISGVITVRGEVIPVIDMRKRFGINPEPSNKERTILVRGGSGKVGMLVDEIIGIAGFSTGEISTPSVILSGLKEAYMTGLGRNGEKVVILINIENILSSNAEILVGDAAG